MTHSTNPQDMEYEADTCPSCGQHYDEHDDSMCESGTAKPETRNPKHVRDFPLSPAPLFGHIADTGQ